MTDFNLNSTMTDFNLNSTMTDFNLNSTMHFTGRATVFSLIILKLIVLFLGNCDTILLEVFQIKFSWK